MRCDGRHGGALRGLGEGRLPGAASRHAWAAAKTRLSENPSWARCIGPMAAVMLSLAKVDWELVSPTQLRSRDGQALSLLTTPPKEVRDMVIEGVRQWQRSHMLDRAPEATGAEYLWHRAMRKGIRALGPKQQGAVRAVWSGAPMALAVRCHRGYQASADCP